MGGSIGAVINERAIIIHFLSDDYVKLGISAATTSQIVHDLIGWRGGGNMQRAQSGSKNTPDLDKALAACRIAWKSQVEALGVNGT